MALRTAWLHVTHASCVVGDSVWERRGKPRRSLVHGQPSLHPHTLAARLRYRRACPTMPYCCQIWSSSIRAVPCLDLPRVRKPISSPLYSAAPTTCHYAKRKHTARAKSRWCHTRRATSSCCSILFRGATNHAKARIRLSAYQMHAIGFACLCFSKYKQLHRTRRGFAQTTYDENRVDGRTPQQPGLLP
jgi:hypothetical protein